MIGKHLLEVRPAQRAADVWAFYAARTAADEVATVVRLAYRCHSVLVAQLGVEQVAHVPGSSAGHRQHSSCDEAPVDFASTETATSSPLRMALKAARQSAEAGASAAASRMSGSMPSGCAVRGLVSFKELGSCMLAPWSGSAEAHCQSLLTGA